MVEKAHISDFRHDPKNVRRHNERNASMVSKSIERDGFGRSMLAAKDGTIIAGNQTLDGVAEQGMEEFIVVHSDGTKPIVVVRDDVDPRDERAVRLAVADNRASDLSDFDPKGVVEMARQVSLDDFFSKGEMDAMMKKVGIEGGRDAGIDPLPDVYGVVVECDNESDQTELLSRLSREGWRVRALL